MPKKILHFDDEEMLTNMYAVKFRDVGFEYKAYEHPPGKDEELVNLVLAESPDCIIMDIIMPVIDGFKATEILKSNVKTRDIPLFFATNMSQEEDIERGKSLGADGYIVISNVTPSELVDTIKDHLDKKL